MIRWCQAGLSLLLVLAVALAARADGGVWFGLRNDTGMPIVVLTGVVVNGTVAPGRPLVLYPGEVAWDCSVKPCVKCVALANPKNPKVTLLKTNVQCGPDDVFLSIKMVAPNQFRLLPAPLPAKRPGK